MKTIRFQALRNEEKTKRDAEDALKAATEKNKIDMVEQQQRLKRDAENERVLLLGTHEQLRQELEHRATKAEAELERIKQSLKAQYESVSAPSPIEQEDSTARYKTPDQFKKPRRKVDRRTNTVLEVSPSQTQARDDSQGSSKENIEPRIRTFSELNSLPIDLEIYNDTPTSSLSEFQSMSAPSQLELQLNNTPTQIRVDDNKSSSSWGPTQPILDPFMDNERSTSKSGALANTSSRRSPNIVDALFTENSPLLDLDAFLTEIPGYSMDVQHQSISHSTINEVSQLRPEDAADELTPNTGQFLRLNSMVQSTEKKNDSSSPEFMTESQNLTTYGHPTSSRPRSDSNLDESRKRKSSSAHPESQVSKKSRASLVLDGSQVIPEKQCSQAQTHSQGSKSSQSQNLPQSGQLVSGTRHKKRHSSSQITTLKPSKAQSSPTSMLSQTLPGHGSLRDTNSGISQSQSRPLPAQPLTGMSRARSSQTNKRNSNRRTRSAKAMKKSTHLCPSVRKAEADIALGDRYADRFNEELTHR